MKVSIIMLTYNHEKFITRALEGVVMQETDFPFELIIANDHSTDRTEDIVRQYRELYPSVVKGYVNKKNLGPRHNFIKAYSQAIGEYIAMCEGDDYWTDPLKLQKQVNFLEKNREYVLCFHDIEMVDDNGDPADDKRQPIESRRDFRKNELLSYYLPTPTILYRKVLHVLPAAFKKSDNGDAIMLALLTQHGSAKYIGDIQASYVRIHQGGIWSTKELKHKWRRILRTKFLIYKSLDNNLRKQVFDQYVSTYEMAAVDADSYKSAWYWYFYNYSYLRFCLFAGQYGKAWLLIGRMLQKIINK